MRILTWPLDDILKEVDNLEKQSKGFKEELYKICWYMRGSISLTDVFEMAYEDREILGSIIKDNLETTKKSGLPFF